MWTESREQGWRTGGPQAKRLPCEGFWIAFPHPSSTAGKPAGPEAQEKVRINVRPSLGHSTEFQQRPRLGWKWGVGAGPEVPDKGGSRVWVWDADPPHPQSLGTGWAP